jgi:hypothetical protein
MGNSLSKFELMYKYYNEFNFEIKKRVKNSYPFLEYKNTSLAWKYLSACKLLQF